MFATREKSQAGFTLIELMIVVVIIGILAALAIPRFMRSTTKSKQSEARSILKQVYMLERTWRQDHDSYTAGLNSIGMEITPNARYTYSVTASTTTFTAIALCAAPGLDEDASADEWRIDQTGNLWCQIDDSSN